METQTGENHNFLLLWFKFQYQLQITLNYVGTNLQEDPTSFSLQAPTCWKHQLPNMYRRHTKGVSNPFDLWTSTFWTYQIPLSSIFKLTYENL